MMTYVDGFVGPLKLEKLHGVPPGRTSDASCCIKELLTSFTIAYLHYITYLPPDDLTYILYLLFQWRRKIPSSSLHLS